MLKLFLCVLIALAVATNCEDIQDKSDCKDSSVCMWKKLGGDSRKCYTRCKYLDSDFDGDWSWECEHGRDDCQPDGAECKKNNSRRMLSEPLRRSLSSDSWDTVCATLNSEDTCGANNKCKWFEVNAETKCYPKKCKNTGDMNVCTGRSDCQVKTKSSGLQKCKKA